MVCRLCLKHFEDLIYIFNATDQQHNMAEVVAKYFRIELRKDDPISTVICRHCWLKLTNFHEFYGMVENAQRQLADGLVIKTENNSSLPNKCDLEDEFEELGEVPFNMFDDVSSETGKIATGAFNTNAPRDVLLINEINNHDLENGNEDELFHFDSKNNESTNRTTVKKNMSNSKKKNDSDKIKPLSCFQKQNDKLTRKCKIKKPDKKCSSDSKTIKRKRGRPKTRDCKPRKPIKTKEEQDSYKAKMKEYDDQIAQYMSLYCDVCSTEAYNFPALRVHMRDVHSIKDGYVTCCDKKFNKRALLVYHIRHHLNPDCYRCEECKFTFADRQSMHNHFLVKHQKDEDKLYECSECPKKFSRKYLLEQHNAFSHRGRILKCKSCNKRFKTSEELTEHNKDDCSSGTMCDICAKVIRGTAAFKRHQLEHQGVTIPKEQCDICGLWYKDSRGLKRHRRRHMESKEPHACSVCQKISPSRSAMLSHKRYAHGTERVYECSICKKNFKKPISLREHMTTHTGEILYNCPHCPKTFNSNANMHSHRKKIHPMEFEETRKLRKQNIYLNGHNVSPAITMLGNVKNETEAGQKGMLSII